MVVDSSSRLIASLQERAKELNCLYRVEEILSSPDRPLEEVFLEIVEELPKACQYTEICQARIVSGPDVFAKAGYLETPWLLCAPIHVQETIIGRICISYTEERPLADTGVFLREEVRLLHAVADRLGHFILRARLRRMFHDPTLEGRRDDHAEWKVAVDLLKVTNPGMLDRISRKMINHLGWSGVTEANELLQRHGEDSREGNGSGEVNQPRRKTSRERLKRLVDDTFEVAARHLSEEEILDRIQRWLHEEQASVLIKPLMNVHATLTEITEAVRAYQNQPERVLLTQATSNGLRVALIRRMFTEQLEFINVAKKALDVEDFFGLLERIISPSPSHGKLGGKSAGLFVAWHIVKKAKDKVEALGEVRIPKTWYVSSDGLMDFVQRNNLEEVYDQKYRDVQEVRQDYPHIIQIFKNSRFSSDIVKGLSVALDDLGDVPLVVRSSSLLEDRLGSAFSGKYKSLFLANQGTKEKRLEELMDAIAEVYASTFGPDPIEYRGERGLLDFNEEMAIMIQEVVGQRVGRYFVPAYAGVAFSNNEFRWSPRIKREDGLLRLVPGLGTRAVDRLTDDYPVLIAPGQPNLRVNQTMEEAIRYSPRRIDVIDLLTNSFTTLDVLEFIRLVGDRMPMLSRLVQVRRGDRLERPSPLTTSYEHDDLVVTLNGVVEQTDLVPRIKALLKVLADALKTPVDIEFAHDGKHFYLLQCRPQSRSLDEVAAELPAVPVERTLFTARRFISNGKVPDLSHVVYVNPDAYNEIVEKADLIRVGEAVGRLNKLLPRRRFILIGPGRWGSRGDIKLGVRVTYSDVNNTCMLIEVAKRKGSYVPDLSFGTHFFQDLVEASIRYLPLYPDDDGVVFNEAFLMDSPNALASLLPEYEDLAGVIQVIEVSRVTNGKVLRVLMNAEEERALAYFADPASAVVYSGPAEVAPVVQEEHWRWRLKMAEQLAANLDEARFGVKGLFVFGSTKNGTAGPGSDLDLLVHFNGTPEQRVALDAWLDGWSRCLAELNYHRTDYLVSELLDVKYMNDQEIQAASEGCREGELMVKVGGFCDQARRLALGGALKNPPPRAD